MARSLDPIPPLPKWLGGRGFRFRPDVAVVYGARSVVFGSQYELGFPVHAKVPWLLSVPFYTGPERKSGICLGPRDIPIRLQSVSGPFDRSCNLCNSVALTGCSGLYSCRSRHVFLESSCLPAVSVMLARARPAEALLDSRIYWMHLCLQILNCECIYVSDGIPTLNPKPNNKANAKL